MSGLFRRFLRRRNMSSSRIYCCNIIILTKFKEKLLEEDELIFCVIISSVLKKKLFYVTKMKECRKKKKKVCPFFLLKSPRPLSVFPGPQTSYQPCFFSMPKALTAWITINCGKFLKRWDTRPPYLPTAKLACRSRSNSWNQTLNNRLVPNRERSTSKPCIITLLI